MALIVNLFGTCCAGKSTTVAMIFSALKMNGINAELVTEYAKDAVYEDRMNILKNDQLYVFAKQQRRIRRIFDKVDETNLTFRELAAPFFCCINNIVRYIHYDIIYAIFTRSKKICKSKRFRLSN